MRLSSVVPFLRANVLILLLGMFLGGVVGWAVMTTRTPVYAATATVLPGMDGGATDTGALRQVTFLTQRVYEYAALAKTDSFIQRTVTEHQLPVSGMDLRRRLTIGSPTGTGLISATVRSDSPVAAADEANAVAQELVQVIPEREKLLPIHVTVVEPAEVPATAVNKASATGLIQYMIAGLTVGFAASLVRAARPVRPRPARPAAALQTTAYPQEA